MTPRSAHQAVIASLRREVVLLRDELKVAGGGEVHIEAPAAATGGDAEVASLRRELARLSDELAELRVREFGSPRTGEPAADRAEEVPAIPVLRELGSLRVAAILDDISTACFAPECRLMRIAPTTWRDELEAVRPDLLLVESAWSGNSGAWQYRVGSYPHVDYAGIPDLRALTSWCRDRGIPTVFWNKEDPIHHDRFLEAAGLFDHVFSTDAGSLASYERLGTARSVGVLQFAAQPRIHNPARLVAARRNAPAFAGTYYRDRHDERRRRMELLLDAARPHGLVIFDRVADVEGEAYGFPERFRSHVVGSLPYARIDEAYKGFDVLLNVNTVDSSPTMFARRVTEMVASDALVVSTPSVGMTAAFGDTVASVDSPTEAEEALRAALEDGAQRRERRLAGRRLVMREHTYRHRLAQVAAAAGIVTTDGPALPVAVVVEESSHEEQLGAWLDEQTQPAAEVLVAGEADESAERGGVPLRRVHLQARDGRMRTLASLASSPWVHRFDPERPRSPHDLSDLVAYAATGHADLVGRPADDAASEEHVFAVDIDTGCALARRSLVVARSWPEPADLATWIRAGVRVYAGDAS
ncbi:MAG: hypothetical protein QOJ29_3926 [Thermoleophilaceae bacterium]|nr:hypothetical protein [Thermoleophilaceae bacterium]